MTTLEPITDQCPACKQRAVFALWLADGEFVHVDPDASGNDGGIARRQRVRLGAASQAERPASARRGAVPAPRADVPGPGSAGAGHQVGSLAAPSRPSPR
jgi:hypothetical protein